MKAGQSARLKVLPMQKWCDNLPQILAPVFATTFLNQSETF